MEGGGWGCFGGLAAIQARLLYQELRSVNTLCEQLLNIRKSVVDFSRKLSRIFNEFHYQNPPATVCTLTVTHMMLYNYTVRYPASVKYLVLLSR